MSNPAEAPPPAGAVETKTKAGAIAAYVSAFLLFAVLTNSSTDLTFLPDWLETIIYPLLPALVSFLASYLKKHKPGQLSLSAKRAAARSI
jgi:uncharacterized membrane protein YhdT